VLTCRYDWLGLEPGDRVLDLGCGGGRHAFEAARRGAIVTAADLDLGELKQVRDVVAADPSVYVTTTNADALQLPFPDASFDRIIASEVMEHIPDDAAAAKELARVLRPGGTMAVTVPAEWPERICWKLSDEYHAPHVIGGHVRIYEESGLRSVLHDAGLEPGASHRSHALHSPYWWLKCAVGPTNDTNRLVQAWHRLLVWDIVKGPAVTRAAEKVLSPVLGKSLVVYSRKPS
jgi:SAM-dependent methyltransferase